MARGARGVRALSLVLLLGSCGGEESFSPTVDNVSGSYSAQTFTVTTGGSTTNLLALGSTVDLTLGADGTTTGRLFVPEGGEGGEDLDVDLVGTWTLTGSTVAFEQAGDTFIRDVEFTAGRNRLSGEADFSGTVIRLVLNKSS